MTEERNIRHPEIGVRCPSRRDYLLTVGRIAQSLIAARLPASEVEEFLDDVQRNDWLDECQNWVRLL